MTTYSLPISDKLAARLASLTQDRVAAVNAELTDLITDLLEEWEPDTDNYPLTADDLASIQQGLQDSDAGRVIDGETFFTQMRHHLEQLKEKGYTATSWSNNGK